MLINGKEYSFKDLLRMKWLSEVTGKSYDEDKDYQTKVRMYSFDREASKIERRSQV